MQKGWRPCNLKKGEIPNGFGGFSTRSELRDFIRGLDKRGKAEQEALKMTRDIAVKALTR